MGRDVSSAARVGGLRRMLGFVEGKVSHFQAVGHFARFLFSWEQRSVNVHLGESAGAEEQRKVFLFFFSSGLGWRTYKLRVQ